MTRWFYTGLKMQDGTPRTICAGSKAQEAEYIAEGLRPVDEDKVVEPKTVKEVVGVKGVTKSSGRKRA